MVWHILPGVETELQFQYEAAANFMTSTAGHNLSTYLIIAAKSYYTMFNTLWFTLPVTQAYDNFLKRVF